MKTLLRQVLCLGFCLALTAHSKNSNFVGDVFVTAQTKLWTEPTKFGEPIADLDPGLKLDLVSYSTSGSWARVTTPSGREGWILVRHTSLSGLRSNPTRVAGGGAGEGRNPASIEGVAVVVSPWKLVFDLGYANQLNRSAASGILTTVGLNYVIGPRLYLDMGLGYGFFADSEDAVDINARTQRSTHRFFPFFGADLYLNENVSLGTSLGFDLDRTEYETRDLTTTELILTDGSGLRVTGGEWNYALSFRLQPKFLLPLGEDSKMGFFLGYDFTLQFGAGDGDFAGSPPANQIVSTLGAGIAFQKDF